MVRALWLVPAGSPGFFFGFFSHVHMARCPDSWRGAIRQGGRVAFVDEGIGVWIPPARDEAYKKTAAGWVCVPTRHPPPPPPRTMHPADRLRSGASASCLAAGAVEASSLVVVAGAVGQRRGRRGRRTSDGWAWGLGQSAGGLCRSMPPCAGSAGSHFVCVAWSTGRADCTEGLEGALISQSFHSHFGWPGKARPAESMSPRGLLNMAKAAARKKRGAEMGGASPGTGAESSATAPPTSKRQRRSQITCVRCGVASDDNCSNFATIKDARGKVLSAEPGCLTCSKFAATKGVSVKDLSAMEGKDKTAKNKHDVQQAQMADSVANIASRPFRGEQVYYRIICESRLEERYTFTSRADFKAEHGIFPEDAKVLQARVTNKKGEEVAGVITALPDAKPTLIVSTTKQWIRHEPKLDASEHLYEDQASEEWLRHAADFNKNMGQTAGCKYKPKLKSLQVYTDDAVADAVAAALRSQNNKRGGADSGLADLGGGDAALDDEDSAADDEDDDSGMDDEDGEEEDEEEAQETKAVDVATSPPPKCFRPPSSAVSSSGACTPLAKTSRSTPCKDKGVTDAGLASDSKRSRGAAGRTKSSAASSACGDEVDDASARVKPPSYWMRILTPSMIFAGKNLNKQIVWGEACERRIASTDPTQAIGDHLGVGADLQGACHLQGRLVVRSLRRPRFRGMFTLLVALCVIGSASCPRTHFALSLVHGALGRLHRTIRGPCCCPIGLWCLLRSATYPINPVGAIATALGEGAAEWAS